MLGGEIVAFIETLLSGIQATLMNIGPMLSIILIVMGGITYGLAQTQAAETRGKWQAAGIAMFVGGVIIAAVTGAAALIQQTSSKILT